MIKNDRLTVSAYWSARRESAEKCAERATIFLEELRKINARFSSWYLTSRSRKNAKAQPLVVDTAYLGGLFMAGVNRRDDDRSPIPELGFRVAAWAGDPDGVSVGLSVTCGSYSNNLDNVCILNVTEGHDISADALSQIVDAAVKAWSPDAVEVNSKRVYPHSA